VASSVMFKKKINSPALFKTGTSRHGEVKQQIKGDLFHDVLILSYCFNLFFYHILSWKKSFDSSSPFSCKLVYDGFHHIPKTWWLKHGPLGDSTQQKVDSWPDFASIRLNQTWFSTKFGSLHIWVGHFQINLQRFLSNGNDFDFN
jgi:hypothetical protein